MPSRRYDEHGYLLVDEKPFYAIRKSKYPAKKSPHGDVDHFLEQLDALDFQHIESDDLIALTKKIVKNGLVIPLGSLGLIDYFIECAQLRPGSLNNDGKQTREERAHVPELLQKLAFTNVNGVEGAKSARLALPLGRLYANHHHENRFTQSRWIIMIDQTRLIWALYADGIDKDDADKKSNGNLYPYNGAWDTAFGANRAGGERVVLLGSISDIPFQEGQRLDHIRVQGGVGWSTTPSEVDLRKPLIDPSVVHRLLEIDTRLFDIPDSTIFKCKNIFELEHDYGYWSFCWSVQNYNEVNGFVIGRTLVEGAWCKIVTWFFKNSADGRKDVGLRKCVNSFNDCIAQSQGKDGQKFWDKLEKKYPGIDVAAAPFDMSTNHNASLEQYLLSRSKDFKCPAKERVKVKKEPKSEDKMDIVETQIKPTVEGKPAMTREEAEKQGLIRFISKPPKASNMKDEKVTKPKKEVKFADDMNIDSDQSFTQVSSDNTKSGTAKSAKVGVKKEAEDDKMVTNHNKPTPNVRFSFAKASRLARLAESPKPNPFAGEPVYGPPTKPEAANGELGKGTGVEIKVEEVGDDVKEIDMSV